MINCTQDQQNLENGIFQGCKKHNLKKAKCYVKVLSKVIPVTDLLTWQQFLLRLYREINNIKIKLILKYPVLSLEDKVKLFDDDLFSKPGQREFFKCLIKNHHLELLPDIIVSLQGCFLKAHQIVLAKVFTKDYLTEEQVIKLRKKLELSYQKKVILQNYLDSKVIGGMVVYIDGKKIDYTIRGRLQRLKQHLLEIRVC